MSARYALLKFRLLRRLGSPKALAAAFGAGFLSGYLPARSRVLRPSRAARASQMILRALSGLLSLAKAWIPLLGALPTPPR